MIDVEGQPVGWIQWYWWTHYPAHAAQLGAESGSAGIDLAIGEEAMTGRGLGTAAIGQFLRKIVSAESVFCDPEEANVRSLRAFEKAGFTAMHSVQLAGEDFRRRVVRLTRSRSYPA